MANVSRIRAEWSGSGIVGPAVSTFFVTPGEEASFMTQVRELFQVASNYIPQSCTVRFPNQGEVIDILTGKALDAWSVGTVNPVGGQGQDNHAAGVGCRIVWQTAGFNNGRRVKGATYIVPLSGNIFDAQGTIVDGARSAIETQARSLVTNMAGDFVVWSRSRDGLSGSTAPVVAAAVPDRVSWLRSRRT